MRDHREVTLPMIKLTSLDIYIYKVCRKIVVYFFRSFAIYPRGIEFLRHISLTVHITCAYTYIGQSTPIGWQLKDDQLQLATAGQRGEA